MDKNNTIERPTIEQIEKVLERKRRIREGTMELWSSVRTLMVFASAAILVTTLLLPLLQVRQGSMNPTLRDGDILVCIKTGSITKGDIIAFRNNNAILIKRVIATAGDKVEIDDDGVLILNNIQLNEPYAYHHSKGVCTVEFPLIVPDGQFFVMGDNRPTSLDSRSSEVGFVDKGQIVGKALLRLWPLDKIGTID